MLSAHAIRISPVQCFAAAVLCMGTTACIVAPTYDGLGAEDPPPGYPGGEDGAGGGAGGADGAGSGASGSAGGIGSSGEIPCDVAAVLAVHCDGCHAVGVPPALVTLDDWLAPSSSDPSRTMAQQSVVRMQDAQSPMPTGGVAPASDVEVFANWVAAGTPPGDCGGTGAGGSGSGPSPYGAAPTCTSSQTWNNGDNGGSQMFPGQACNDCHADENKVIFQIAGTVYPSAHEPNNCYGVNSGQAVVEIIDADGAVFQASTNGTGNFTLKGQAMQYPVTAKVIAGGQELAMVGEISAADGDCNRCHNQAGAEGAPGRIILPF